MQGIFPWLPWVPYEWTRWYAWYPVRDDAGRLLWLRVVECRSFGVVCPDGTVDDLWEFRA